ncbi:hypothetical protein Tco_0432469 [Tanacetum coccineum]
MIVPRRRVSLGMGSGWVVLFLVWRWNGERGCGDVPQSESSFPLRSFSLYAPFPNDSVTSYSPSHLGLSLPPSSAWLASLLRRSKFISKVSSFFIKSTSAVRSVGMPISAGRMRVLYPNLASLSIDVLILFQTSVCSFDQAICLWMLHGGETLADT